MPGISERLGISNNMLAFLVVIFLLISSWGNWHIINMQDVTGWTSEGSGTIGACVNKPPTISHSCTLTAYISQEYECDIDAVKDAGENLTFYDYTSLFDINATDGMIRFTPTSSQAGSYLINITVKDNSSCSNDANSTIIGLTIMEAYCGDGTCGTGEDCSSCSTDCGSCPTVEKPAAVASGGGGGSGVNMFDIDFSKLDEKIFTRYAGEKIVFTFNGVTPHNIYLKNVEEGYIVVSLDKGADNTVNIKETKKIDINGDGVGDIIIFYMSMDQDKKAQIKASVGEGAEAVAKDDALPIKIDPESIKILLRVGTTFEQKLSIRDIGSYDFNVALDVKNLGDFLELSETEFVVYSMGKKELTLVFKASPGQQPGVYTGKIFVEAAPSPGKGEKIYKNIPVIIEVESADVFFDATIDIPSDYREVMPGLQLKALVTLFNLKKVRPVDVDVDYIIKDMYGNEIAREKDTLSIEEQVSFEKTIKIPEGVKEGEYVLIVQTRYGSSFSTTSQKFYVGKSEISRIEETKAVVKEVQSKYNMALFAGVVLLFGATAFMFMHYRKRIGTIEKESKEKIVRRLEELEQRYRKEYEKTEEFMKDEEEKLGLDRLADFIKEHLEKGFDKERIREHLKDHGWKDHHIDHAMRKASKKKLEEEIENLRRMIR
ncbi:hypothetical protein COV19_07065 [Candidatus Woesearchaeota archaeon CG10_big_fil_rev_8_21_14_0_10_44_13]|nr:MAG: hypothetical protein COV19_07065 [Candidatus Woesearchaeota archaeon CG10_big_fil_rev_8_21_14_0_10_44_13]